MTTGSENNARADELLDLLDCTRKKCTDMSMSLTFGSKNTQHSYATSLYSLVFELAGDCSEAARSRKDMASHVLARVLLEAAVDLVNVTNNPDYARTRFHEGLIRKEKQFQKLLDFESDLISKAGHDTVHTKKLLSKGAKLRDPTVSMKQIKARFKGANMMSYYYSIYSSLCDYSHIDASVLLNRPFGLRPCLLDNKGILRISNLTVDLILRASISFHNLLGRDQTGVFEDLGQKWGTKRNEMLNSLNPANTPPTAEPETDD